jgi:hypothetical protein
MREPLGLDPEIWHKRNERQRSYWKKYPQWVKGYKSGRKGLLRSENPYTLDAEILKLLRKRTYWDLGWEEGAYTPSSKKLKRIKEMKEDELKKIKKEFKGKKKHGHHKSKH